MAVETNVNIGRPSSIAPGSGQQPYEKFTIINLCGGPTIVLKYFPSPPISLSGRATWEEQEVTIGTKPLAYFNRDPFHLDVQELYLDNTDTGRSIKPDEDQIRKLEEPSCNGAPPPLVVVWGDHRERVILEEYHIDETFHAPTGIPLRAKVSLSFKEIQQ